MKEFLKTITDYNEREKPDKAICIFIHEKDDQVSMKTTKLNLYDVMSAILLLGKLVVDTSGKEKENAIKDICNGLKEMLKDKKEQ